MKRFTALLGATFNYASRNLILLGVLALPLIAWATDPSAPLPESDFWTALLLFFQKVKGLAPGAAVYGLLQLTIVFFRTPFGNIAGVWKLVVIAALGVAYTVVGHLLRGLPVLDALLDGTTVAAVAVLIDQLRQHWAELVEANKPVHPIGTVTRANQ